MIADLLVAPELARRPTLRLDPGDVSVEIGHLGEILPAPRRRPRACQPGPWLTAQQNEPALERMIDRERISVQPDPAAILEGRAACQLIEIFAAIRPFELG